MKSIRFTIDIDNKEYEIIIKQIDNLSVENKKDADIWFYTLPHVDDPSISKKIKNELNSICNEAFNTYKRFRNQ